ncbi:Arf family guanine nucleotide exchange factor SEC7, partial [Ascoidea rubescens DSM 1968]
ISNSIDAINDLFNNEDINDKLELSIVQTIMSIILNSKKPIHGVKLLNSIRLIYNIYVVSIVPMNQQICEASLNQIIDFIYDKVDKINENYSLTASSVPITTSNSHSNSNLSSFSSANLESQPKVTLANLENLNEIDDKKFDESTSNLTNNNEDDLIIKDAFLIFRTMSKISSKQLDSSTLDPRSQPVRSKLLGLKIIHSILNNHIDIFLSNKIYLLSNSTNEKTKLIDAVRNYLLLTIFKNSVYRINKVFEITLNIFFIMVINLRAVFKQEISLIISEVYFNLVLISSSTKFQKDEFLRFIYRIGNDPRCLIEFYINYDCDASYPNIVERITNYLVKTENVHYRESLARQRNANSNSDAFHYDTSALNCIVGMLRSLATWASKATIPPKARNSSISSVTNNNRKRSNTNGSSLSYNTTSKNPPLTPLESSFGFPENLNQSNLSFSDSTDALAKENDDPNSFGYLKQRKTALYEGIRSFNYKPSRGITRLIADGFISSESAVDIAKFLLLNNNKGIDKKVLGEYLGEGEDFNIEVMHEFVDLMNFKNLRFIDAIRFFLQSFRLPGEAQKIDRFMLKFAERYHENNPNIFANAVTPYILSYSVILLNTDMYNLQVKVKMNNQDFIKNNSGIDDGKDLPVEFLNNIYNDIAKNEIKLVSEHQEALFKNNDRSLPQINTFSSLFGNKEAAENESYNLITKEISTKTEKLFKNLDKQNRINRGIEKPENENNYSLIVSFGNNTTSNNKFFSASHIEHVKSIFETLWMSFLGALTPPFKEYDDDDISQICLEGIKLSIKISCIFDIDYARASFVNALIQFTNLQNLEEIKEKNIKAIKILLDICISDGNNLKSTWKEIIFCISQLERLQLIAQGIEPNNIPDVSNVRFASRSSIESTRSTATAFSNGKLFSFLNSKKDPSELAQLHHQNQKLNPDMVNLVRSSEITVGIDRVFSNSAILTSGIFDFVSALSEVANEEIESSGSSGNPRIFALQKMVDVCYYSMDRIRLEWSQLWAIMEKTFNTIGSSPNQHVVIFALDSLKQLSMRFLDIEELAHFKFQKEFLKSFGVIIRENEDIEIQQLILDIIQNMIDSKAKKIKSGWFSIFNVLKITSNNVNEDIIWKSYKLLNKISKNYLVGVYYQESFEGFVDCLVTLAENERFQKISLHAIEDMKLLIRKISSLTENGSALLGEENEYEINSEVPQTLKKDDSFKSIQKKLWFPILFGLHDVIMKSEDLEVRSRALNYLFDSLVSYGSAFSIEFWDDVCKKLLFPIFGVLSKHWELSHSGSHDDLSVWLSTTLIQALRNMIALFTHFDNLLHLLDEYLLLLESCILQENDTISRIGRSCLQQLILQNMSKFDGEHWDKILICFKHLFKLTTAIELFKADPLKQSAEQGANNKNGKTVDDVVRKKAKEKSTIVVKCVLQLLVIETVSELFEDETFYDLIPTDNLLQLSQCLKESYRFSRKFNDDYNLRVRLWNSGVIERLPNLLRQESSSSAVFVNIMFRLIIDKEKATKNQKDLMLKELIPLCVAIVQKYIELDDVSQQRNINTWRPVVVEILQGYYELDDDDFITNCPVVYELVLNILDKALPTEMRSVIKSFLTRVGEVYL